MSSYRFFTTRTSRGSGTRGWWTGWSTSSNKISGRPTSSGPGRRGAYFLGSSSSALRRTRHFSSSLATTCTSSSSSSSSSSSTSIERNEDNSASTSKEDNAKNVVCTNKFLGRSDVPVTSEDTPSTLYAKLVASGELRKDDDQEQVLRRLDIVFQAAFLPKEEKTGRGGVYIYGPAGSGKSLSMDLFHLCLLKHEATALAHRKHFHEFVYDMN